ncbi:hypothetical protein GGR21_000485 [Dysgonomonas hofstadii]|uniref:Uncharacterized protein n=1 Tax=Dysgonomonas hofstadii TaxID=637886 RepID=A0A840CKN3_9BACT|nr:DUF6056 family protein [Dysgonomonas hofstadii]MBB4034598.1 hypothetical protein [Dysgonomonas hofstadii]
MNTHKADIFDKGLALLKNAYHKADRVSMSMTENKARYTICWIIVIVSVFGAILFLNILTPLISDDFAYLFIYGEQVRAQTLSDIVQSQVNHYYMWGGRSVVHFIAQVLLLLPAFVADLLNTLIYMGYIFLIYLHIKGRGKHSLSLFILINLAVWFFQPVIGDTIFWITGAANYLWGTFFILLFLLPYRMYKGKAVPPVTNLLASAGMLILGVLAGWTNENTAGAMILIAILFIFYYHSQKWKFPVWALVGLAGGIAGFLIMILAPGNFERAGEAGPMTLFLLGYRLFNSTFTYFYYCGPLILVCLAMIILYRHNHRSAVEQKMVFSYTLIYYIAAIAGVYAMILSPTFPRRALFGVVTFMITGAGILWYNINYSLSFAKQLRLSVLFIGLLGFGFTFYLATKQIDEYRKIVTEREVVIRQAKNEGRPACEFTRYDGSIYIHGEDPFSAVLMSRYYGIKIEFK